MKASELRIGNIVDKGTIVSFYEKGIHVGFGNCFDFNKCNPIPLTKEWLLKFGFTFDSIGSCHLYSGETAIIYIDLCPLNLSIGINYEHIEINHIKYVHQLQNLYFALTGEELI